MTETLESTKRRTERKVRKRNDCLKKQKELQKEREREREGGHFYALSILVLYGVNGGGARFYIARGSSVRNNCTLKTFLENAILFDRFVSSTN